LGSLSDSSRACLKSSLDFLDAVVFTDYLDSLRETLYIGWLREFCTQLLKKTWNRCYFLCYATLKIDFVQISVYETHALLPGLRNCLISPQFILNPFVSEKRVGE
jgi:hypothetical protein